MQWHEMGDSRHRLGWWYAKVAIGLLLIAQFSLGTIADWPPRWWQLPLIYGQLIVVAGALVFLYHYWLLKRTNRKLNLPDTLICQGGLYPWIRHPMYTADAVIFFGFLLLYPSVLSIALFAVGVVALLNQAQSEDQFLAQRFGAQHAQWRERSGLLTPKLRRSGT